MTVVGDLTSLVAVQPNSIVSTTVLKAEGARVVLFAFDAGQELTEHTAAVPVLLQTLTGRLVVTAGGRSVDLLPGDLLHLPSGMRHAVLAPEPSRLQLTLVHPRSRRAG